MNINQFGGGSLWISLGFGGGLLFSLKKCQNGGSVNIFHQIWPNYRENLLIFCFFWGGVRKFFSKKFLPWRRFGGGVHWVTEFWGGSRWDRPKMGGVSIRRPKGAKLVHPPPGMFMTPSLNGVFHILGYIMPLVRGQRTLFDAVLGDVQRNGLKWMAEWKWHSIINEVVWLCLSWHCAYCE